METSSGSACFLYPTFPRLSTVALNRATFYLRPDLPITGVSYVWRRAEVSIPIRVLAVPTVFKAVLRAVAINPPNIAQILVLCAVSHGAFKDCTSKYLSEVYLPKPNLAFSIRSHCVLSTLGGSHALMSRTKDSW